MSKPILVMVHGRAQGGKDRDKLRSEWIETWARGLKADQKPQLDEIDIRFPFYADELDELTRKAGAFPADVATRGDPGQIDPGFVQFRLAIAAAAARKGGVDLEVPRMAARDRGPLQWGFVQRILQGLENVPGLSGSMIERFTRDVWVYLKYPVVRAAINAIVEKELPEKGRIIMLGHSLGSVVAYDVLRNAGNIEVPLFMTVGSPLGIKEISGLLNPIGHPKVAAKWFNAFDDRDVVALNPLDKRYFATDPAIENYGKVKNRTENAHGIVGYLDDKQVAARLFAAVTG